MALEHWSPGNWTETLAEEQGEAKLVGAAPEEEGGPASALEGKCGKGKMVLGDLLSLSSFLPSPCLIPQTLHESKASFMLCRKKEEVRNERQKIFRVAKPHTTLEDFILTPESSCHNPVLHLSSVVLIRGEQTLYWCSSMLPISFLPPHFMLENITDVISHSCPSPLLGSNDLKEYPLAGDSCYYSPL